MLYFCSELHLYSLFALDSKEPMALGIAFTDLAIVLAILRCFTALND